MEMGLADRTALVTGSSAGIGRVIAMMLAVEGCAVVVHGRDPGRAEAAAQDVRQAGGDVAVVVGDLDADDGPDRVLTDLAGREIDVLVNNAGPFSEHSWDDVDAVDWHRAWRGNVVSAARLSQVLTRGMRERGWGRVITVGSRAATTPLPNMVEYSAAKGAVVNLTVSLAAHLAGSGVTANCVSPGVVLTPSLQQMFLDRGDGRAWADLEPEVTADYAPNPSGRLGRPEDVAAAVVYLASGLAGYVNGVDLRVDGGITGTA